MTSAAMLARRRASATSDLRENRYGRAERMSSTGTGGRSASKAGFVLTALPILEADTLHDRVPAARVRPRCRARSRPAGDCARPRTGAHPRGVRRQGRHLRPHARPLGDVRLPAWTPVGVHAAALRVLPRAALLDPRPSLELVGIAQIAVAIGTALVVYEIGRRVVSPATGVVAAALATLHPYLVWHDVHVNREILDQFLAASIVLLVI